MTGGCPRTFCDGCGEELIHRDNRKFYESASAFGQIIGRRPDLGGAPRDFGCGDVDLFVHRSRQGMVLLRWVEHKQPGHKYEASQQQSLSDFDLVLKNAIAHPPSGLILHPDSGVFIVRGPLLVPDELNPHRKVDFGGSQQLCTPAGDQIREFTSRVDLYRWLRGLDPPPPAWKSIA